MTGSSAARQFDVAVIGNAGIDTNIYLYGGDIDWRVEANFTENLDYVGQAGGYASRGYAALGLRTAFIGAVGDDHQGHHVREVLAADGIDTSAVWIDPAGTARSVNIMYRDGRRKNFYDGKGHMTLVPNVSAARAILAHSTLAHFNIPNWGRGLLTTAKECGVIVACDIQDVSDPNDPYRHDFLSAADFLFFSAANQTSPAHLIARFLERNPRQVVVCGMGAEGCGVGLNGSVRLFPPVQLPQPVVDTNGAGDALAVGFLSSYVLEGYALDEAVLRGQIAARHSCAQRASSSALITARELNSHYQHLRR
jgi:acarbose 7IV-phosphotransferase